MPTVFRGIVWHTLAGFLLFTPAVSHAWFIFVPGSITQGISDAVTGAKGDICVGSAAHAARKLMLAIKKNLSLGSHNCSL